MLYIKFFIRLAKLLTCFVLIEIPLQLVGACILAVYLPIHMRFSQSITLPYILRWFDCADFYTDRDTSTYRSVFSSGVWKTYCWLAWRNPINYFEYKYLGVQVKESLVVTDMYGDPEVGNSTGDHPGFWYLECLIDGKVYYEYYYILKFSPKTCLRFRMGYKLGEPTSNPKGTWIQHCLVFQPYRSYSGV